MHAYTIRLPYPLSIEQPMSINRDIFLNQGNLPERDEGALPFPHIYLRARA